MSWTVISKAAGCFVVEDLPVPSVEASALTVLAISVVGSARHAIIPIVVRGIKRKKILGK